MILELNKKLRNKEIIVCIIGIGYVGLPLSKAFSKHLKVIGYDIDVEKLKKLSKENNNNNIVFTSNPSKIEEGNFILICVPTPITKSKDPDLSYIKSTATTVGKNLKKGVVVVIESTVYPGVTEEIVVPILERESGLKCGPDFKIGYSPERINPGDIEHSLDKVTKIVAGMDDDTTELLSELYSTITNVFKAKNIKTAEAAKVIENIQRDLNISLMNELSIIFHKIGLDTRAVINAASTKWNFNLYQPGLVGGHCIPVDPFYLVYKAEELDYHPQVILAGRTINDYMPKYVAEMTLKALNNAEKVIMKSKILIMGLTYKEDVPDTREAPVIKMINELKTYGVKIFGYDPLLTQENINKFGISSIKLLNNVNVDCVIITVFHKLFKEITLDDLKKMMNKNPVLIDIKGIFNKREAIAKGFSYNTL